MINRTHRIFQALVRPWNPLIKPIYASPLSQTDASTSPSCYSSCRASHFTGPPFACSPHPAEKGQPTPLRRGEGMVAVVPSRRARRGKRRWWETRGIDCVSTVCQPPFNDIIPGVISISWKFVFCPFCMY